MKKNLLQILTGLLIAGFFSSAVYAATYYSMRVGASTYEYVSDWTTACQGNIDYYVSVSPYTKVSQEIEPQINCNVIMDDGYQYTLLPSAKTCTDPLVPNSDGVCTEPLPSQDCSTNINTLGLTVTQNMMTLATDGIFDVGGCAYYASTAQCKTDTECLAIATGTGLATEGTGVVCDEVCQTSNDGTGATITSPLIWKVLKEAYKQISSNYDSVTNPDGSITETVTTTTTEANNAWDNITYDGQYYTELTNAGTTTTTTEVQTTTTNLDGSTSTTTETSISGTTGSTDTTVTNSTDGTTTNTSTSGISTNDSSTNTTTTDSNGNLLTSNTTDTPTYEDPDPQDCGYGSFPDCKINETGTPDGIGQNPLSDGAGGQGLKDADGHIAGIPTTDSGVTSLSLPDMFPNSSLCQKINLTIFGFTKTFPSDDGCSKLDTLKTLLGYFFYVLTVFFIFNSVMNAGTKV